MNFKGDLLIDIRILEYPLNFRISRLPIVFDIVETVRSNSFSRLNAAPDKAAVAFHLRLKRDN